MLLLEVISGETPLSESIPPPEPGTCHSGPWDMAHPIYPIAAGKSEAYMAPVAVCLSIGLWDGPRVLWQPVLGSNGDSRAFLFSLFSQGSGYLSQSGAR